MPLYASSFESPIGWLIARSNGESITEILFVDEPVLTNDTAVTRAAIIQLGEYFSGTRTTFDLPLAPQGTNFEKSVWNELINVEYGTTESYLGIAKKLKNTGAIRAVGRANGANPIAIIVPCHRIVGSDGTLTGYAGGLWRKRWLLDHEARTSGTLLL